jgi:peroxiredoxin
MRFDSLIEIPVVSGKFHYESKLEYPEAVTLFLGEAKENGGGRYMPLFLENEKIDLTIHSEEEFDKNIIEGGNLNAQHKKFKQNFENKFNDKIKPLQDSISSLFKSDEYNSDKAKLLYTELREAKNQDEKVVIYKKLDDLKKSGENLSPKAKDLDDKIKPIYEEQKVFQENYIKNNPTIISYSFLLDNLIFNKETIDINNAKNTFQVLSKTNPNHPYNELASNLINAIENIKIGKKYTDFSAPDLNGNSIKLSDKINGKIALLDLWATWCGPCIAKSRTMVPLYNEYKDKGFTIVGVAGEFKNTDRLVKFLDKEKWEWLNLVELDRKNSIWQKYGVDGGGGGIFLIDEKGIILAKDPTSEEVRKELESRLN